MQEAVNRMVREGLAQGQAAIPTPQQIAQEIQRQVREQMQAAQQQHQQHQQQQQQQTSSQGGGFDWSNTRWGNGGNRDYAQGGGYYADDSSSSVGMSGASSYQFVGNVNADPEDDRKPPHNPNL